MMFVRSHLMLAWVIVACLVSVPFGLCGQRSNGVVVQLNGICVEAGGDDGMVVVRVRAKDLAGNVVEEEWTDFDGAFRMRLCREHIVGDSLTLEAAFPTFGTETRRLPARSQDGIRFSLLRTDTLTVLGLDSVKNFRGAEYSYRGCGTSVDPDPLYIHCNGTIKRYEELKQEPGMDWEEWRLFAP